MTRSSRADTRDSRRTSNRKGPMRKRILVIDDDVDIRVLLRDRLEAMGFEVVTESNGLVGLVRIELETRRARIDGVLLELHLPVLGGMAVMEKLQRRYPEVPVIVMSAAIYSGELQAAIKSGASDYIAKPVVAEVFENKCRKVFLQNVQAS